MIGGLELGAWDARAGTVVTGTADRWEGALTNGADKQVYTVEANTSKPQINN